MLLIPLCATVYWIRIIKPQSSAVITQWYMVTANVHVTLGYIASDCLVRPFAKLQSAPFLLNIINIFNGNGIHIKRWDIIVLWGTGYRPHAYLGSFCYKKAIILQYNGVHGISSAFEVISYEKLHVGRWTDFNWGTHLHLKAQDSPTKRNLQSNQMKPSEIILSIWQNILGS